jgi:hypothetical protein
MVPQVMVEMDRLLGRVEMVDRVESLVAEVMAPAVRLMII